MTPFSKAVELYNRFYTLLEKERMFCVSPTGSKESAAKGCALMAVEEMIPFLSAAHYHMNPDKLNDVEYWKQVKEEIGRL